MTFQVVPQPFWDACDGLKRSGVRRIQSIEGGRQTPPIALRHCPPQVTDPQDERPPIALAMEWVAKITTVALEMVLPGLLGEWLDGKFGTNFLALVGFALGITVGVMHLLAMTRQKNK